MADKQQLSKEEIDAGINAYEDEHCAHLAEIGKLAQEAGIQIGGNAPLPDLNPDGSYVDASLESTNDDEE
jgi:hypothetical protein